MNALRLHSDAILLYKKGRFPSAFVSSILSQEEIGKMGMVNDFVWHSSIDGRSDEEEEKKWLKLLFMHPHKQTAFWRFSPLNDYKKATFRLMDEISNGKLEAQKQGATYVGLKRIKGEISHRGRIVDPFQITAKISRAQITKINDYLLVTGFGVRYEFYSLDNDHAEALFTKKVLNSLDREWKYRSNAAIKNLKAMHVAAKKLVNE